MTKKQIASKVLDIADSMQNAHDGLIAISLALSAGHDVSAEERQLVEAACLFVDRYRALVPKILGVKP